MQSFSDFRIIIKIGTDKNGCMTDLKTLVVRAKNGDADALGQIYEMYAPKMRRVCARLLNNESDVVDDLLHDSFVLAYTSLDSLQDAEKLGAWLAAIIRNVTLRYLEVSAAQDSKYLSTLQDSDPCLLDTSSATDAKIITDELMAVIDKLPEGYQKILRLHIFEGYSHQDIAMMLGIAPHSSSSQLSRAKSALRKMMAERKTWLIIILAIIMFPVYRLFVNREQGAGHESEHGKTVSHNENSPRLMDGKQNGSAPQTPSVSSTNIATPLSTTYIASTTDTIHICDTTSIIKAEVGKDLVETENKDCNPASTKDTVVVLPSTPTPSYDIAEVNNKPKKKGNGWQLLASGSLGSSLAQNGIKAIPAGMDITSSSEPREISNWELYYQDLRESNPQPDEKTRALMEIAANNSGDIVEHEDHQYPITFGLALSKQLSDHWSIETGFQYSLLRSTSSMGSNGYSIDRQQKLHYIGIPLQASLRLWKYNSLAAYVSGGMTLNIPIYGNTNEVYVVNYKSAPSDSWHVSAPWQLSVGTGVGLQYQITPNIGLYVAPTLNYYIPTGSSVHSIWTKHPFTFSAPFGLKFTW